MPVQLNGTTGYLRHDARVVTGFPFSIVFSLANDVATGPQNFCAAAQAAEFAEPYFAATFGSWGNNKFATHRHAGGTRQAQKTAAPHPNITTMQWGVVVFTSANSRTVYFGDSTGVTDTATGSDASAGHTVTLIGALKQNSAAASLFTKGHLAEVHFYGSALTSGDVGSVIGGALPETLGGWVDGWALQAFDAGGTYTSIGGSRTMTAVGGVSASGLTHPVTRGGDTTAPTLSSPTGAQTGASTASGTVSTNEATGTLYRLASTNATETVATIKAANITQAVTATGSQAVTFTGLTASTTYYAHYVHRDAAGNDSAAASSASFTTSAGGDVTAPVLTGSITVGAVTTSSIQMSWPAGSDNVAVVGYDVSSNGGSSYTQLGNVLTHTFTGLAPSTAYQLRVRARDAAGNLSAPVLSASQSTRHGVLGSVIRANTATGTHGPGLLYNDWDPGDDAKEFRALIVTPPASGTLVTYEDGSFELTGAANGNYSLVYRLFVDGVDLGTATASFAIGNAFALSPAGIASTNAFGTPSVSRVSAFSIAPAAIPRTNAFGAPSFTFSFPTAFSIAPAGIASTTAFGVLSAARVSAFSLAPSAIPSTTAFGTLAASFALPFEFALAPSAIPSAARFGTLTFTQAAPPTPRKPTFVYAATR
jgi:chitodextrinase